MLPVGLFDFLKSATPDPAPAEPAQSEALREAIQVERQKRGVTISTEETNSTLLGLLGYGGGSIGGVAVTQQSAMSIAALWSGINAISQDIAGLPIQLIRQENDTIQQVGGRPVSRLLNLQASPLQNAFHFRQSCMALVLLRGNVYAIIRRDGRQEPYQLDWKHPDETEVRKSGGRLYYKFSGDPKVYQDYEVLHFRGLSLDGVMGVSVLHYHRETLGKNLAASKQHSSFYNNGAKLGGVLETDAVLNKDSAAMLRENFTSIYAGAENAGKVAVLEQGLKFRSITLAPADAEYINTAKLTRADIFAILRFPPHKGGDLERSTNNNIEQQSLDYVGDTLMPWILNFEQELRLKLLRSDEIDSHRFKHTVTALLRADHKARGEYYGKMTDIGVYTINDVLALEDRNGIGPQGDLRFVQVNRQTLEQAEAGKTPTTQKVPADVEA